MATTVKVNINVAEIISSRHMEHGGKAELFMTSEIHRLSMPYTPFDNNPLSTTVKIEPNLLTYEVPYAQRMWHGKVMAGNPLEATDKEINFQGSPMRGKEWVTRMDADRHNDIADAVEKFIKEGK